MNLLNKLAAPLALAALTQLSVEAKDLPKVSINVNNCPTKEVFSKLMQQAGVNFIYSSDLQLSGTQSLNVSNTPLDKVLDMMFDNNSIAYKVKGNNVMLYNKSAKSHNVTISGFVRDTADREALIGVVVKDEISGRTAITNSQGFYSLTVPAGDVMLSTYYTGFHIAQQSFPKLSKSMTWNVNLSEGIELNELVVLADKNQISTFESTEIGSTNISKAVIANTPVIFGEADVIKTLQLQPGVSAGVEGMAGMYVHGGNNDENLYMLDNIPLYQINHFGGLFSAFNTEAIKNVDFYKSSFPAKYNGRLSSIMDVHTKDGSMTNHHGSFKLGLTSGAFNIDGPIWKDHTTYSVAVRRSWFDVLTVPTFAIINKAKKDGDEKSKFNYAFTDVNAKINHHFSDRSRAYIMFYWGNDYLTSGSKFTGENYSDRDYYYMNWGNLVGSLGWNYNFSDKLFGEFTAAYTNYRANIRNDYRLYLESEGQSSRDYRTDNSISDWTLRADLSYKPTAAHHLTFGANATLHSYRPQSIESVNISSGTSHYGYNAGDEFSAREFNFYLGEDWSICNALRANVGTDFSIYNITGKSHLNLTPRASLRYKPNDKISIKGSYSHMVQYIHQLTESSISLPTDQWIPIMGDFKPQTSDKYSIGAYYKLLDKYTLSAEVYYKRLNNIIDYVDNYYSLAASLPLINKLTSGKGTAKGLDLMFSKDFGKITGHVSYSLLWADRTFEHKNNGVKFPARFDNRHKINVLFNWKVNPKWEINISWTGMSGNMTTLPTQVYAPLEYGFMSDTGYLTNLYDNHTRNEGINNYRLPFYHRMDLGLTRYTKHGFWNFSFYNVYCNMNVIGVRRDVSNTDYYLSGQMYLFRNAFQKIRLIPIIPSVSYTWKF